MDSASGSKYLTPCRNFGLSRNKKRAPGPLDGQSTCGTPSPLNAPFRSPLLSISHPAATNLTTPIVQSSKKTPWSSPLIAKSQLKMGLSKPSIKNHRHSWAALQPKDLLKSMIAANVDSHCSKERPTRAESPTDQMCDSWSKSCKQEDIEGARSLLKNSLDIVEGIDAGASVSGRVQKKGLKKSKKCFKVNDIVTPTCVRSELVKQGEEVSKVQRTVLELEGDEGIKFDHDVLTDGVKTKSSSKEETSRDFPSNDRLPGGCRIDVGCEDSPEEDSHHLGTFGFRGWDLENDEECRNSSLKRNAFRQCLSNMKSSFNAIIADSRVTRGISIEATLQQDRMKLDTNNSGNDAVGNRNCVVILEDCQREGSRSTSSDIYRAVDKNGGTTCSEESEVELAHSRARPKKYSRTRIKCLLDSDDDEDSIFRVEKASSSPSRRENGKRIPEPNSPCDVNERVFEGSCVGRKNPKLWRKKSLLMESEHDEGDSLDAPPGEPRGSQGLNDVALGGLVTEISNSQESKGPSRRRIAVAIGRKIKLNRKQIVLSDSEDDELVSRKMINDRPKVDEEHDRISALSRDADLRLPEDPKFVPALTVSDEFEEGHSQNSRTATSRELKLSSGSEDKWDFFRRSKLKKNSSLSIDNKNALLKNGPGLSYSKERIDNKEEIHSPRLSSSKEIPKDETLFGDQESMSKLEKLSEAEDFERLKTEMRKWLLGGQRVIGEIIEEVRQQKEKEMTVMDVLQEHGINPDLVGFDPTLDEFVSFDKFLSKNDLET